MEQQFKPEMCFAFNERAEPGSYVVAIKRGESGFFRTNYDEQDPGKAKELVNFMNRKLGVTLEEAERMSVGSMFGWDVPGAQSPSDVANGKSESEISGAGESITNRLLRALQESEGHVSVSKGVVTFQDGTSFNLASLSLDIDQKPNKEIVVVIEGGLVQSVLSAEGGFTVAVIDYDRNADADNGIWIPQTDGEKASAYAAIHEPEVIDKARVSELYAVVEQHTSIAEIEDSLKDAMEMAQGKESYSILDPRKDQNLSGKLLGVSNHHFVVSTGRSAVIIELADLKMEPDRIAKDEMVEISFKSGKGMVQLAKAKELER